MITLWRDDDINKYSNIVVLKRIQELFDKYGKIHTVAIEMEGLWDNNADLDTMASYLKSRKYIFWDKVKEYINRV